MTGPASPSRTARLGMARLHAEYMARGLIRWPTFREVEAFALFIGYPRSGHSLIGSLLNAHRNVVISHELDVLRYVAAGFTRIQIFAMILDADRRFGERGRKWSQFDYAIPGEWQGRSEQLRVIGDKKGGRTTEVLRDEPALLDRLRDRTRARLKVLHVVRNPFDNIATMSRYSGQPLQVEVGRYESAVETNGSVLARLGPDESLTLRHEDLVAEPHATLRRVLGFLGVPAPEDFVDHCAGIVFPRPRRSSQAVDWAPADVARLQELAVRVPFLSGYAFNGEHDLSSE